MKKNLGKLMRMILLAGMVLLLFGGCNKKESAKSEKVNIRVNMNQPEYQVGMVSITNAYMAQHPNVTIELNSSNLELSVQIAGGETPDVFVTVGYQAMKQFLEHIRDVSDQPWVSMLKPFAKPCLSIDGKIYGMPVSVAGLGVIYNKKMFAEHNWAIPQTWTEFINLCEKVKAAGIIPLTNEFGDAWYLGNHFFGANFAYIPNTENFLERLYSRQATFSGSPEMQRSFNILDTMLKYGQPDPLAYFWNEASSSFALGQSAMFFGGDWYWDTLYALNPQIECGIFGFPLNENPNDTKMVVDVSWVWHVAKVSKNPETALDYLNWMATNAEAKKILLTELRIIPCFEGWEYLADNQLGMSTLEYFAKNKVYSWPWVRWPSGYADTIGSAYQEYISGNFSRQQVLAEMDNQWNIMAP